MNRILWTALLLCGIALSAPKQGVELWSQKPVVRPSGAGGATQSKNPIDAFIARELKKRGLRPAGPADKATLLRRVYLDLIGLPPTPAEQDAFLKDESPDAYEKVVDRLLADPQHGVRYGRHWLDVLRYADVDERMYAQAGIHLWRDWVIHELNRDLPYDQFVRAQLTGYRNERTRVSDIGIRSRIEPRPDDMFALGFLARGGVSRDNKDTGELPIVAVETVSTAFMGLTVGCAKCHDHMYDPISQKDFYAMKALFDPLVVKKVTLATPAEILKNADAAEDALKARAAAEAPLRAQLAALEGPIRKRLEEERILMLPAEAQAAVRKPERQRTFAEQKMVDDYFVPLRVDPIKVKELLPEADRKKFDELTKQIAALGGGRGGGAVRPCRRSGPSKSIAAGRRRPATSSPAANPIVPRRTNRSSPAGRSRRPNRISATAGSKALPTGSPRRRIPFFARVAVNRLWQWHFGEGLQKSPSDFGTLGGVPTQSRAARLAGGRVCGAQIQHEGDEPPDGHLRDLPAGILASTPSRVSANSKIDPANDYLWTFPLDAPGSRTDLGLDPVGRRNTGSGRGRSVVRHRLSGSAASRGRRRWSLVQRRRQPPTGAAHT